MTSLPRPVRALLASAVLACACHHAPPHKPGDEWLRAIDFKGNHAIKRADLEDGLAIDRAKHAGRAPDDYQIRQDADRLKGQYARDGYFAVDVQPHVDRKLDAVTVTYVIEEGKRAKTHVVMSGLPDDPAVTFKRVRAELPIAEGAPFDYDVYDTAKVKLLGILQDAGYAHAKLDAHVVGDVATNTAVVQLAYTPGPKCKFGKVDIEGVDGDLRDAIRHRLHFGQGDTYSTDAVTRTQRDIYGMQRFSTVQVQPEPGESDVVDMKVSVSEAAAHEVTLGGGVEADPITYQVQGRVGYMVSGWPSDLDTFTLDLRPAYAYLRDGTGFEPRMRAIAKIDRQDLFLTHAVGTVEADYNYLAYEAFTEYGPQGQLGYELRLGSRRLKLRLGYLIHHYDFTNTSPLLDMALIHQIGLDRSENLGAVQQSIVADYRDNPVEPRYGVYGEVKVFEATPFGTSYNYEEVVPDLRGYVPVGPIVLAARARFGAIFGAVPPTERFYAGGATSNRGFAERELSPSVTGTVNGGTLTVPYGGAGMIDSSGEVRFPIASVKKMPLGGVVFLDAGDVTDKVSQLNVGNLNYSAGVGLRLKTLVGPVRADFGYRLNRTGPMDPEPGTHYAFHLSLGEAY